MSQRPTAIKVNVTTNAAEVAKNMGAGQQEMLDKLPYILRAFMVLTIRDLLDKSHPVLGNDPRGGGGNTNSAVDQAEENLTKEINRVFTTWDKTKVGDLIMAKNTAVLWSLNNPIIWRSPRMKRAWEKQDIDTLYKTFKMAGWEENPNVKEFVQEPTEELHDKLRDSKTGGVRSEIAKNPQLRIAVRDREAIENYILQKQLSIGKMANGWVKALAALGHNIPTPFKGASIGSGGATISGDGLTIKANNAYGDFNSMISRWGIIEEVLREQGEDLKDTLQREVNAILAKHATPAGGGGGSGGSGGTP